MNHTKAGRAKSRRRGYEEAWLASLLARLRPCRCDGCDYCRDSIVALHHFTESP